MSFLMTSAAMNKDSQESLTFVEMVRRFFIVVMVITFIAIAVLIATKKLDVIPGIIYDDGRGEVKREITDNAAILFGLAGGFLGIALLVFIVGYFYGQSRPLRSMYLNSVVALGMIVALGLFAAAFFISNVDAAAWVIVVLDALLIGLLLFYLARQRIFQSEFFKKVSEKLDISEDQVKKLVEDASKDSYVGETRPREGRE